MNSIDIEKKNRFYICNEANEVFKSIEQEDANNFFLVGNFDNKELIVVCQG